jgi:endonuclease V-like protein UPF0215 family
MGICVYKKALRSFGISESYVKGIDKQSVLAGVVMRADRVIDGFIFSHATLGGMDATNKILEMYFTLKRDDIRLILLNGYVISWYNVIDLNKVAKETGLPLICITYKESEGLEKYFQENFPLDCNNRIKVYQKNKRRIKLELKNGYTIYTRFIGIKFEEVKIILDKFTSDGSIPEPLRISRLMARALVKMSISRSK